MKKRATRAERDHLALVASLPCVVCGIHGVHVHHLPNQGGRRNHYYTIPLCSRHHVDGAYGEAVHQGRKSFEANFGTEIELLAKVNKWLKI